MPNGYLVTLGDNSLDAADVISGGEITFTADPAYLSGIGSGEWTWSGTAGGTTYTDELEPGVYWLADSGDVYFVPDFGPVDTITSASVTSAPAYVASDGIVTGTGGDDIIDSTYTDSDGDVVDGGDGTGPLGNEDTINAGLGDDTVNAGAEDDVVYGGGGSDVILGGAGDDTIYGDTGGTVTPTSEKLDWTSEGGDGTDLSAGFTQDTGEMDVSVSFVEGFSDLIQVSTDAQYADTGEPFDTTSGLQLGGSGTGTNSTTTIDFAAGADSFMSNEVENVTFRLNDIDQSNGRWQDQVTVIAYDADGNAVVVTLTAAGADTVSGGTVTAATGQDEPNQADGSVLVEIAGPVQSIEIVYENLGTTNQYVWISDVHFDTIVAVGNDTIDGGTGDDVIYGEDGDDIIQLTDNFGNDTIVGGETGETNGDTLDASGLTTGVNVTFTSADGEDGTAVVGGDTATFEEIENVIYTDQDDTIDASATTVGMVIDAAGGNDTVTGGSGADIIDGGAGDDTIAGGTGDDTLTGGTGADNFVYTAGDGADVITDFDPTTGIGADPNDPASDQTDNDFVDLSAFYDAAAVAAYNAANGGLDDLAHEISLLREDAADGTLDGIINGVNIQGEISGLNLTIENGGAAVDPGALYLENTAVVCFGRGTLIATKQGDVPVEDLAQGDLVLTADNGYQPIRWIGSNKVSEATLAAHENLRPIRIRAGALGMDTPAADLIVSPQHRVLVRSKIAKRMFDEDEVLVAAKQLLLLDGIDIAQDKTEVEYFHFLFDRHEVVCSNGALTESLYTGPEALKSVSVAARSEILELFPELRDIDYAALSSRKLASGRMGRKLALRHVKNGRPLVVSMPVPAV